MDLQLLKTFLLVAQTENITQTAEKLKFSQPTITAQIKNIEEDFGVLLFERVGKKLYITEAGKCLVPYAKKILDAYREAQVALDGFSYGHRIRIGLGTAVASYILSPILHRFHNQVTDVSVCIDHCIDIPAAVSGVLANQFDFALVHDIVTHPKILQFDVMVERLCWCVHKDLYKDYGEDFWQYPFILLQEGSLYRQIYGPVLEANQIHPILEYSDSEAVKQAILNGFGVGILPQILVKDSIRTGMLVEFANAPILDITFSLILHKEKKITKPIYTLLQLMNELHYQSETSSAFSKYLQNIDKLF